MAELSMDKLAEVFGMGSKQSDFHTYGTVKSINSDGSYQVQLNRSTVNTRCASCCQADVGSRVLVSVLENGTCAAVGTVGSNGRLILQTGTTSPTVTYNDAVNPRITFKNTDGGQQASLVYSDYDSYQKPDSVTLVGNQAGTYFIAPNLKATEAFRGKLLRDGVSSSWINGRDNAMVRQTSLSGYSPFASIKTSNGTWEIGAYNHSSFTDDLIFSFASDSNYSKGTNATTQIQLNPGANGMMAYFPVGAVYLSYVSTSPASLFGGTWTQITGRFLRMANDVSTGGSDTHTLTTAQLPGHTHGLTSITGTDDLNFINGAGSFLLQNSDTTVGWSTAKNAAYKYGNTGSTGSGSSHNNMPAYQDLYAWRRTA